MNQVNFLPALPGHSRIWLYLAEKPLNSEEQDFVKKQMQSFTQAWQAHGAPLSAAFDIWQEQLLIIGVDETTQAATGCSIDASYRIIKQIEQTLGLSLSNRLLLPIWANETLSVYKPQAANDLVNEHTNVLDLTHTKLSDFREKGIRPISETWMRRYLPQTHASS